MKNRNNTSENPLENAPFLSKIEKKNDFTTPKNYFKANLEIINTNNLENKYLQFVFDKLSYRFLIPISAFSIVIIILLNYNNPSPTPPLTADQISEVLIYENYTEIDEYLLTETYVKMLENEIIQEENKEDYINYLIENDIDISIIINEL